MNSFPENISVPVTFSGFWKFSTKMKNNFLFFKQIQNIGTYIKTKEHKFEAFNRSNANVRYRAPIVLQPAGVPDSFVQMGVTL